MQTFRPFIGSPSADRATGFLRITTRGVEEVIKQIERAAGAVGERDLKSAVRDGMNIIAKAYRDRLPADVTGNLRKSVGRKTKVYSSGVVAGIVGPRHRVSGKEWDVNEIKGAGNHSWLVEYGSKPRRPGTNSRRTYVNVHRRINGKMSRSSGSMTDTQFANASRGYYFIMSSYNEPTRKKNKGKGYPHDFLMTLHPGETYPGMPDQHPMERAIISSERRARGAIEATIKAKLSGYLD